MKIIPGWRTWLERLINPKASPELEELLSRRQSTLPVLWLMGKTGAGKSSIIQRLTGDSKAQIGNGFEPCTSGSAFYDYPADMPAMRFLDTRGLAEASYDPSQDLTIARRGSHALLLVTRVDDPSQATLCRALKKLSPGKDDIALLQIHSALHAVEAGDLDRARRHNEKQIAKVLNYPIPTVSIDFTDPADGFDDPDRGRDDLQQAITDLIPDLERILARQTSNTDEEAAFVNRRTEILGYCSAAAAIDLVPAVGLVAVPSIQGKMLHALAARYGIDWDRRLAAEFVAALGSTFLYRYLWSLAGRQILKFVPIYGQSAGAATAASISFASTYALGRAVCLYLYRRNHHQSIDSQGLRSAFKRAFEEQR